MADPTRMALYEFVATGRLRQAVEGKLAKDAVELLVDVVLKSFGRRNKKLKKEA